MRVNDLRLKPDGTLEDDDSGLYVFLMDKMATLEPLLCEFYVQLIRKLGLLGRLNITLDGKEQTLTEELMQSVVSAGELPPPARRYEETDVRLFKGAYITLFQDGSVFQKIMYRIFEHLGESKIVWIRWKTEYRLQNKSNPKLRTFYRYIDYSFLAQLPIPPYVSMTTDALLYCEWRCSHPNLVGFHMLILAWMLNVHEFRQFVPPNTQSCSAIVDPLLKLFWKMSRLQVHLTTVQLPSTATLAPGAPEFKVPASKVPASKVPASKVPASKVPASKVPATKVPGSNAPSNKSKTAAKNVAKKK